MLNLLSVRQMLAGWKMKRVVDPALVDRLEDFLVGREEECVLKTSPLVGVG